MPFTGWPLSHPCGDIHCLPGVALLHTQDLSANLFSKPADAPQPTLRDMRGGGMGF